MTEQPKLSEVLGLKRKEIHSASLSGNVIGYNQCLDDLDQLSPDVDALTKITIATVDPEEKEQDSCWAQFDNCGYDANKISKEVISSMSKWIKKG